MKPNWIPEIVRANANSVNLEGEIVRRIEFVYKTYYCKFDPELKRKIHRVRKIVHDMLANEELTSIKATLVVFASLLLCFAEEVREASIITILLFGISDANMLTIVHENPIRYRMVVMELAKKFTEKAIPFDLDNALNSEFITTILESESEQSDIEEEQSDIELPDTESEEKQEQSDIEEEQSDIELPDTEDEEFVHQSNTSFGFDNDFEQSVIENEDE
jgi:hypothetical protein